MLEEFWNGFLLVCLLIKIILIKKFWKWHCFSGINESIQADLQIKVTHLIVRVLIKNQELHYYQVRNEKEESFLL